MARGRARVPDVSASDPGAHHLSRSLLRCQQCSAKKVARGFALLFRRECFSIHDISFVAAEGLPSLKPCKLSGSLPDELVLVSVLAPLYSAARRLSSTPQMRGAGGCRAIVSEDQWCSLYDLSEELDWNSQPPDPVFSDTRGAAAWNAPALSWRAFFSFVVQGAHQPPRNCKCSLALATSRFWRTPELQNTRRVNYLLRKVAALCFCDGFQFDIVWAPMWGNPADAPSWVQPLSRWRRALQRLSPQSQASLCIKLQSTGSFAWSPELSHRCPVVKGSHSQPRPSLLSLSFQRASPTPTPFFLTPGG